MRSPACARRAEPPMFSPFERAVAFRYLRARKGERFVSVIAVFSLVGIALGVATLIIVTSVMNGFRQELLRRILRLDGHPRPPARPPPRRRHAHHRREREDRLSAGAARAHPRSERAPRRLRRRWRAA